MNEILKRKINKDYEDLDSSGMVGVVMDKSLLYKFKDGVAYIQDDLAVNYIFNFYAYDSKTLKNEVLIDIVNVIEMMQENATIKDDCDTQLITSNPITINEVEKSYTKEELLFFKQLLVED